MRAMTVTLAALAILFTGMAIRQLPTATAGAQHQLGTQIDPAALYKSLDAGTLPETTAAEPF